MKDELILEISLIKSMLVLLSEHFDCKRFKGDMVTDWYSIQRYFHEYNDLLYIIQKKDYSHRGIA